MGGRNGALLSSVIINVFKTSSDTLKHKSSLYTVFAREKRSSLYMNVYIVKENNRTIIDFCDGKNHIL